MSLNIGHAKDFFNQVRAAHAIDNVAITAGSTNDNTEKTGQTIDLLDEEGELGFAPGQLFLCGLLAISWKAVLSEDETFSLAAKVEQDDNTGFISDTDIATLATVVVATGGTGGSTVRGVTFLRIPALNQGGQYARCKITGDCSKANTDTAEFSAVYLFGGSNITPA